MRIVVLCYFGGTYSKPYKNVAYSIGSEPPRGAKSENSTNFLGIHPIFGKFHKNHPKLWNYHKFRISGSRGALKSIGTHWHYVWFGAGRQKAAKSPIFMKFTPISWKSTKIGDFHGNDQKLRDFTQRGLKGHWNLQGLARFWSGWAEKCKNHDFM